MTFGERKVKMLRKITLMVDVIGIIQKNKILKIFENALKKL